MSNNVVELLLEKGIRLKSYQAGNHRSTCPICSDTRKNKKDPCLSVDIDDDGQGAVWNCHHCQDFGSVKEKGAGAFIKKPLAYKKPEATIPVGEKAVRGMADWFQKRGISSSTLEHFNVRCTVKYSEGQNRAMIAFGYWRDGELVSNKYRRVTDEKPYGYTQDQGTEQIFYGIDAMSENRENLVIVEGEIDALSVYEATRYPVLSVPTGAKKEYKNTNDKSFHYLKVSEEILKEFKTITIATDNDDAGIGLRDELARRIGKDKCKRVNYPANCKDMNDVLRAFNRDKVQETLDNAEPFPIVGVYNVMDYVDDVMNDYDGVDFKPLTTGFSNLDPYMKVMAGQVSIVTGIPNSGKSEFLDQIMLNMADLHDWKFGICSFENRPHHHIRKLLEKHTGFPFYTDGQTRRLSKPEVVEGMEYLNTRFKFIRFNDYSKATPSIENILGQAKRLVLHYGIKGIVIDPFNEIDRPIGENSGEGSYISLMLSKVRQFAEVHDCHVWIVAHPRKMMTFEGQETPVPTAYDISGSATWADKGDLIWAVSRDRRDTTKPVQVYVHKVREKYCGQVGMAEFDWNRLNGRYSSVELPFDYSLMKNGTE